MSDPKLCTCSHCGNVHPLECEDRDFFAKFAEGGEWYRATMRSVAWLTAAIEKMRMSGCAAVVFWFVPQVSAADFKKNLAACRVVELRGFSSHETARRFAKDHDGSELVLFETQTV